VGTIYLLRHAKSSWDEPELADDERPLAARGRRNAAALAEHVRTEEILPELILCSTARRARETLAALVPVLDGELVASFEHDLYGASAPALLARLQVVPEDTSSVMLIGHNPGLEGLAVLLAGDQAPERIATSVLVELETGSPWNALGETPCRLVSVTVPR
jgi:phosphohistidine phosphatase